MKTPQWDDKGFGVRITDLTVSLGHKFVEIGAIHSTLLMKRGHETAAIASGRYIIVADLRRAVPFQPLLRLF